MLKMDDYDEWENKDDWDGGDYSEEVDRLQYGLEEEVEKYFRRMEEETEKNMCYDIDDDFENEDDFDF